MENTQTDSQPIFNRVSGSGLVTLDLEQYYHLGKRVQYNIKDNLHQGLILKEKEFRHFIKSNDWSEYDGANVALYCSDDVIIPTWAFMLLAATLQPHVHKVVFGSLETLEAALFEEALSKIEIEPYLNAKVVIKGCGGKHIPVYAYVAITELLLPVAQSIMYGEPCSTVPIFKRIKPSLSL